MSDVLVPCKVCGAPAHGVNWVNSSYVVECSKNDRTHCVYVMALTKEEAIDLWNGDTLTTEIIMDEAGQPPYREGDWIYNSISHGCSRCGFPYGNYSRGFHPVYCPNCGRMIIYDR